MVKLIQSEDKFKGKAFSVRQDTIRYKSGKQSKLDIVLHSGGVGILPIDKEGNVLLVRQYRHATGQRLLEIPAGTLEEGESPEDCAAREIREETGYASNSMNFLGSFYLAPGYSTELMHLFLARDLHFSPLDGDEDEELSVERYSLEVLKKMLADNKIQDAKTLSALLLALNQLR